MLTFEDVSAGYGDADVIRGVSFSLPGGRISGLVGESGSGKSTIARVAAGILAPTSGRVLLDGKALGPRRDKTTCRRLQMVFQDAENSLNPALTVETTLKNALRFHHMAPAGGIDGLARAALNRVGLDGDALRRKPRAFSGGQRQRIALARALCLNPDVLIADEPTSALDVVSQKMILDLILNARREMGLSVLFISHDLGVIRAVCDDVMVIKDGTIIEKSPSEDFFRCPSTEYGKTLLKAVPKLPETLR